MLRALFVLAILALTGCPGPVEEALWVEDCLVYWDPAQDATVPRPHAANCGDPEALGTLIR